MAGRRDSDETEDVRLTTPVHIDVMRVASSALTTLVKTRVFTYVAKKQAGLDPSVRKNWWTSPNRERPKITVSYMNGSILCNQYRQRGDDG
jgi:hypothetical protein